jgi:hypothetical protein
MAEDTDTTAEFSLRDDIEHPIKALERLFGRHIGETKQLAMHAQAIAGAASDAGKAAQDAYKRAEDIGRQAGAAFSELRDRVETFEDRLKAVESIVTLPALEEGLTAKADDLSKTVADVATAAQAAVESKADASAAAPAPAAAAS